MYPAGIQLRTIRHSGASTVETGEDLTVTGRLVASRTMLWPGSPPWRFVAVGEEATFQPNTAIEFAPPVTDQGIWRTPDNELIDISAEGAHTHTYVLLVTTRRGITVVDRSAVGPFPLPTGDLSPLILDTLVSVDTTEGVLVSVPDEWSEQVAQAVAAAESAQYGVEGGHPSSTYLTTQNIDGGSL